MSDENKEFETWEDVIVDFFEYKISKSNIFKVRKYIDEKNIEVNKEKDDKKREKIQIKTNFKLAELIVLREKSFEDDIRPWLEDACNKNITEGVRIIKATHVLKFSHSSADNSGLILIEKSNDKLLTTAAINKTLTFDLAHNNGALISISRFLALQLSGELIIDLILDDRFDFLGSYSVKPEVLDRWKIGFSQLVERRAIKSLDKAKQLYFPIDNSFDKYHLIAPLYSSSMSEEINDVISKYKYGDAHKKINKELSKGKFGINAYVKYATLSVQKFGGAQPQNVSMLNKNRGGRGYLFSTQPPTWENQLKPPVYKKSLFEERFFNQNMKEDIDYLRDFLLRFERVDLSIKDPERRKWIVRWVSNVIDELLFFVGNMQNLPSGWTVAEDIKLKPAHQYLLDPYRKDEVFQATRKAIDWQLVVCNDFASWLNRKLISKDKQFTPQPEHRRIWILLLEKPLREHSEMLDMELKFQAEVEV